MSTSGATDNSSATSLSTIVEKYLKGYTLPFYVASVDPTLEGALSVDLYPGSEIAAHTSASPGKATVTLSTGLVDILFRIYCRISHNPRALAAFLSIPTVYRTKDDLLKRLGSWRLTHRLKSSKVEDHIVRRLLDSTPLDGDFHRFLGATRNEFEADLSELSFKQYIFALTCTMCALEFVCLHELAHLSEGHTQYNVFDPQRGGLLGQKLQRPAVQRELIQTYFEHVADIKAMGAGILSVRRQRSFLHFGLVDAARHLGLWRVPALRFYFLAIRVLFLAISTLVTFSRGKPELLSVITDMTNSHPPILNRRNAAEEQGLRLAYSMVPLRHLTWPTFALDRWRVAHRLEGTEYIAWEESGLKSLVRDIDFGDKEIQQMLHRLATERNESKGKLNEIHASIQPLLIEAKMAWLLGDKFEEIQRITRASR